MIPATLLNIGVLSALKQMARTINDSEKVKLNITLPDDESVVPAEARTALFRIVQEIVNNALKYSEATNMDLEIKDAGEYLNVKITDNGKGFNTASIGKTDGIGWDNIYTRLDVLDGEIQVDSNPGKGTFVDINIPLKSVGSMAS